jgi:hypothetical protein
MSAENLERFEDLGSSIEQGFETEKTSEQINSENVAKLFKKAINVFRSDNYIDSERRVDEVEKQILEDVLDNSFWDKYIISGDRTLTERIEFVTALKSELKALRQLAILKSIDINDLSKDDLSRLINKPDQIKTLDQEQIYGLLRVTQINPELKFNVKFSDLYEAQKEHLATLGWESVAPYLKPVDGENQLTLESAPSTDIFWSNAEFFANLPDDFTIKVGNGDSALEVEKLQFRMIADLQARGYSQFKIESQNIQFKKEEAFQDLPTTTEQLAAVNLKVSQNGFDTLELSGADFSTLCSDPDKKAALIGKLVNGLASMRVLDRGALINFINLMRSSSDDQLSERLVLNNPNSQNRLVQSLNVCVFAPMGLKVVWNAENKTLRVRGISLADVPVYDMGDDIDPDEFSHMEPRLESINEEFSFADLGISGSGVTYYKEIPMEINDNVGGSRFRSMQVSRTMANLDNELINAQNETILREFGLDTTRERFEGGIVKLTATGDQEALMQSGDSVVAQNDFEYSFNSNSLIEFKEPFYLKQGDTKILLIEQLESFVDNQLSSSETPAEKKTKLIQIFTSGSCKDTRPLIERYTYKPNGSSQEATEDLAEALYNILDSVNALGEYSVLDVDETDFATIKEKFTAVIGAEVVDEPNEAPEVEKTSFSAEVWYARSHVHDTIVHYGDTGFVYYNEKDTQYQFEAYGDNQTKPERFESTLGTLPNVNGVTSEGIQGLTADNSSLDVAGVGSQLDKVGGNDSYSYNFASHTLTIANTLRGGTVPNPNVFMKSFTDKGLLPPKRYKVVINNATHDNYARILLGLAGVGNIEQVTVDMQNAAGQSYGEVRSLAQKHLTPLTRLENVERITFKQTTSKSITPVLASESAPMALNVAESDAISLTRQRPLFPTVEEDSTETETETEADETADTERTQMYSMDSRDALSVGEDTTKLTLTGTGGLGTDSQNSIKEASKLRTLVIGDNFRFKSNHSVQERRLKEVLQGSKITQVVIPQASNFERLRAALVSLKNRDEVDIQIVNLKEEVASAPTPTPAPANEAREATDEESTATLDMSSLNLDSIDNNTRSLTLMNLNAASSFNEEFKTKLSGLANLETITLEGQFNTEAFKKLIPLIPQSCTRLVYSQELGDGVESFLKEQLNTRSQFILELCIPPVADQSRIKYLNFYGSNISRIPDGYDILDTARITMYGNIGSVLDWSAITYPVFLTEAPQMTKIKAKRISLQNSLTQNATSAQYSTLIENMNAAETQELQIFGPVPSNVDVIPQNYMRKQIQAFNISQIKVGDKTWPQTN